MIEAGALSHKLLQLPRRGKQLVMITLDVVTIVTVFVSVSWLETRSLGDVAAKLLTPYFFVYLGLTVAVFVRLGFYRAILRFVTEKALRFALTGVVISSALLVVVNSVGALGMSPLMLITNCFGLLIFIGYLRIYLRNILQSKMGNKLHRVTICGPIERSYELLRYMEFSPEYDVVAIVNGETSDIALTLSGVPVVHTDKLVETINLTKTDVLFVLTEEGLDRDLAFIREEAGALAVEIRVIPDIKAILTGKTPISDVPSITVDDLLGRPQIAADKKLISARISGLNVLVTGGGGSIGSELCIQVLKASPRRLIIIDVSEFALYTVMQSVQALIEKRGLRAEVHGLLGTVCDHQFMDETLKKYSVDTIYHAAAYKHVPIVERNIVEGFKTNVLGTNTLINVAIENNVGSFTLVSSDKAVRPTNVMGATKRVAELLCQSKKSRASEMSISIVRFGNVMGSSGSVIPLFKKQIEQRLPVTVTHPAMTRYFMTIAEAAQLVVQASALAEEGAVEVYILEMGEPVNILKLAEQMIRLSGLTPILVGDPDDSQSEIGSNNIPIHITGLRPGEKLFEELHVGGATFPTSHARIFSADSESGSISNLNGFIRRCEEKCQRRDSKGIINELLNAPIDYVPEGKVTD